MTERPAVLPLIFHLVQKPVTFTYRHFTTGSPARFCPADISWYPHKEKFLEIAYLPGNREKIVKIPENYR
ncbi:hypothetical protein [Thalassomonas haliotis]|uniref:Uncharacterized protein n=1 Tax=Thalassomonas haliotis TaxID=485448 RepID=A0ABY7VBY0_9GAMM|nr:hypothetical protein [Thalassomonas haliotis]WDE10821.1 hypothetical protein H3N35_21630 [Thalassomonas haliotis]